MPEMGSGTEQPAVIGLASGRLLSSIDFRQGRCPT